MLVNISPLNSLSSPSMWLFSLALYLGNKYTNKYFFLMILWLLSILKCLIFLKYILIWGDFYYLKYHFFCKKMNVSSNTHWSTLYMLSNTTCFYWLKKYDNMLWFILDDYLYYILFHFPKSFIVTNFIVEKFHVNILVLITIPEIWTVLTEINQLDSQRFMEDKIHWALFPVKARCHFYITLICVSASYMQARAR